MWPSNISSGLMKLNLGNVLKPAKSITTHTNKTDSKSERRKSCETSRTNETLTSRTDLFSLKSERVKSERVVDVAPPVAALNTNTGRRGMKKSREDRYNDDNHNFPAPATLPVMHEETVDGNSNPVDVNKDDKENVNDSNAHQPVTRPGTNTLTKLDSKLSDISNVKFLCRGSHSRIFKGIYQSKVIIIKIMAESSVKNEVAQMEFKLEKDMLARINHPNIIKILGCGEVTGQITKMKRPLMILEALTGGTLAYHLEKFKHQTLMDKSSCAPNNSIMSFSLPSSMVHNKMPFKELQFIKMAKQLADSLHYLHELFTPNVMLIHRDLKPDNIGFSEDGIIKLMDFGLSCTVKKNTSESEIYELSGCTGSYRYMAPEVALNKSYNEKVDIYSFGLLLYELFTGITPFQEDNRDKFYETVIYGNVRPSFDHDESGNSIVSIYNSKIALMGQTRKQNISGWGSNGGSQKCSPKACDTYGESFFGISSTSSKKDESINYLEKLQNFIIACWDPNYLKRPSAYEGLQIFTMLEEALLNYTNSPTTTSPALIDIVENTVVTDKSRISFDDNSVSDSNRESFTSLPTGKSSLLISHGDYNWNKRSQSTEFLNQATSSQSNNSIQSTNINQITHNLKSSKNGGGDMTVTAATTSSLTTTTECESPSSYLNHQRFSPITTYGTVIDETTTVAVTNNMTSIVVSDTTTNCGETSSSDDHRKRTTSLFQTFKKSFNMNH